MTAETKPVLITNDGLVAQLLEQCITFLADTTSTRLRKFTLDAELPDMLSNTEEEYIGEALRKAVKAADSAVYWVDIHQEALRRPADTYLLVITVQLRRDLIRN